eukprot:CAMPEP_0177664130 /NCGR_PEP_ID=MMETSP0447-20121125/20314_1 /TAXON_ID=0 /ORGANISM="Stygamoeba regulata, Strain BSH-02190019" /LENGTH=299 /DNA_ID=CAMNT_0019170051 /DNA_START=114 /DNA_END=1009 /DNA_ORIENTATION=-
MDAAKDKWKNSGNLAQENHTSTVKDETPPTSSEDAASSCAEDLEEQHSYSSSSSSSHHHSSETKDWTTVAFDLVDHRFSQPSFISVRCSHSIMKEIGLFESFSMGAPTALPILYNLASRGNWTEVKELCSTRVYDILQRHIFDGVKMSVESLENVDVANVKLVILERGTEQPSMVEFRTDEFWEFLDFYSFLSEHTNWKEEVDGDVFLFVDILFEGVVSTTQRPKGQLGISVQAKNKQLLRFATPLVFNGQASDLQWRLVDMGYAVWASAFLLVERNHKSHRTYAALGAQRTGKDSAQV